MVSDTSVVATRLGLDDPTVHLDLLLSHALDLTRATAETIEMELFCMRLLSMKRRPVRGSQGTAPSAWHAATLASVAPGASTCA